MKFSRNFILSIVAISLASCSLFGDEDKKQEDVFKTNLEGTYYVLDKFPEEGENQVGQPNPENVFYITSDLSISYKSTVSGVYNMDARYSGTYKSDMGYYSINTGQGAGNYLGIWMTKGQLWHSEGYSSVAILTNIEYGYTDEGEYFERTNTKPNSAIASGTFIGFAQKVD